MAHRVDGPARRHEAIKEIADDVRKCRCALRTPVAEVSGAHHEPVDGAVEAKECEDEVQDDDGKDEDICPGMK